jgi:hypothetical protein
MLMLTLFVAESVVPEFVMTNGAATLLKAIPLLKANCKDEPVANDRLVACTNRPPALFTTTLSVALL